MSKPRLGIGVIGMGWMGEVHSRAYRLVPDRFPNAPARPELVACSDSLPQRAQAAANRHGFAHAHTDWHAIIDDPTIDIVDIATPNFLHLEIVEAAAAAGKHINCEKPVGPLPSRDGRHRPRGARSWRAQFRRFQLSLGAHGAARARVVARGPPGRGNSLSWSLLLNVRQRPAQPAQLALPMRTRRPWRAQRHHGARRRYVTLPRRPPSAAWSASATPSSPSARPHKPAAPITPAAIRSVTSARL